MVGKDCRREELPTIPGLGGDLLDPPTIYWIYRRLSTDYGTTDDLLDPATELTGEMGNLLSNLTADGDPSNTNSSVGPLRPHTHHPTTNAIGYM